MIASPSSFKNQLELNTLFSPPYRKIVKSFTFSFTIKHQNYRIKFLIAQTTKFKNFVFQAALKYKHTHTQVQSADSKTLLTGKI